MDKEHKKIRKEIAAELRQDEEEEEARRKISATAQKPVQQDFGENSSGSSNKDFKEQGDSKLTIRERLHIWRLQNKVPKDAVDGLLNILVKKENLDLPLSHKDLVHTERTKMLMQQLQQRPKEDP